MHINTKKTQGFTLIELMVVITIIAVLAAWASPSFFTMKENYELRSAVNEISMAIANSRAEAIRRQEFIEVQPVSGSWSNGWVAITTSDNATFSQGSALPSSVVVTGSQKVKINPSGIVSHSDNIGEFSNSYQKRRLATSLNRVSVCDPQTANLPSDAPIKSC